MLIALDAMGIRTMAPVVSRRTGVRGRGRRSVIHGRGWEGPPGDTCWGGFGGRGDVIGRGRGVLLVRSTKGGTAALGVLAAVITARPLAVGEESGMIHALEQNILPAVCIHTKQSNINTK